MRPISVLIVDDEPLTARTAQRLLSTDPTIRVHTCFDPLEAAALAARIQPTVILQDMVMPGCDGISMLQAFRAQAATRDVPVIVLSSEEQSEIKAAAFAAGADDYLVKFPDAVEMVARVRHHARYHLRGVEHDQAVQALAESRSELEAQRTVLREVFDRYLSGSVAKQLLDSPAGLELGGETRRVTILMTDLRGYTALTERLPPQRMVALINNYLDVMTAVLTRHGGTIDEFIGDAILALFGAPVQRPDDAARAVACAVEMQLAMGEVNARNRAQGLPEVEMGVGLDTGDVVVGNIGSRTRAKYGVVGSAVNMAARIESYTTGGQVLVSQATLDEAGESVLVAERLQVTPKGLAGPITLHRVGGVRGRLLVEEPVALSTPALALDVRFTRVHGKDVGGEPCFGHVLRLSARGAEIAASSAAPVMENLKLQLFSPDGSVMVDGAYAKVTSLDGVRGVFTVRFTSLPAGTAALIETLAGQPAV